LGLLNAHLGDSTLQFALNQESEGEYAVFAHKDMHIFVTAEAQPLAAEGFKGVLDSPFCSIGKAATTAIVAGHHGHVLVSVGNGPDAFADPAPAPRDDTLDLFETKLILCQLMTNLIIGAARPEAVHWCQSNQLFGTDDFLAERDSHYPLKLYLHPIAHQSGATLDGQRMTGFSVTGSEHLISKPLVFAEGPLPFERAFEHMVDFVTYCRHNAFTFPDGDRFGRNSDEQVIVHHMPPTKKMPAGFYELSYIGANDQRASAAKTRTVVKETAGQPAKAVSGDAGPITAVPSISARIGALLTKRRKPAASTTVVEPETTLDADVATPPAVATQSTPAPDRYSQEAALRDAFRTGKPQKRGSFLGAAKQPATKKPASLITKIMLFPAKMAAAVVLYFVVMQGVQTFGGGGILQIASDAPRPAGIQMQQPPQQSEDAMVTPVLENVEPVADIAVE